MEKHHVKLYTVIAGGGRNEQFSFCLVVVNILAPMLLPIAGILPLMLVPVGVPVKLMATVKDGQLCWAAVAMGASSLYETFAALVAKKPVDGGGVYLLLICFLILPAMVLAAAGSVFSTPLPTKSPATIWEWVAVVVFTILLIALMN